jgi:spore coat protein U-like protein
MFGSEAMKTRLGSAQLVLLALLAMATGEAVAVHDCSVTVTSADAFYDSANDVYANGTVTLTCNRAATDANTLDYRIKADNGLNASGTQRRVRRGASADYLEYELSKDACAIKSNWEDSDTGAGRVMTGTLDFGTALNASTTRSYCIRLPKQGLPTAGTYTDAVSVTARYPDNSAGATTPAALLNYTVWVGDHCVFGSYPGTMAFSYTSFSPSAVTATQAFVLRCSQGTPWTVSVDPAPSPLLGLDYSIAVSPASGTGLGSTGQTIMLTGTMPAGQAGTCATGTCTATRTHTVTITY